MMSFWGAALAKAKRTLSLACLRRANLGRVTRTAARRRRRQNSGATMTPVGRSAGSSRNRVVRPNYYGKIRRHLGAIFTSNRCAPLSCLLVCF